MVVERGGTVVVVERGGTVVVVLEVCLSSSDLLLFVFL